MRVESAPQVRNWSYEVYTRTLPPALEILKKIPSAAVLEASSRNLAGTEELAIFIGTKIGQSALTVVAVSSEYFL